MDPTPNAGSPDSMNPPPPTDPNAAAGAPDHGQEVSALKGWVRENAFSLVTSAVVIALVCRYLDPFDTLKVVLGLGFIIFIHELGHFLAAKWCDVHVNMFSIGFGPAVPFCQYKWGETTYKIGIIPLGGFVQMVGEGDGADSEEAEDDPRSFRKKTVGQRMLIISAGVVMNIILGMACFVAAYLHGVQEKPAAVGTVESGGAAWRAGMRTGDHITRIDDRVNPFFDDIRPIVMGTQKDEKVPIAWTRDGVAQPETTVSPLRDEGQRFPQLGVSPPSQLKLMTIPKRAAFSPTVPGTPAAATEPKFMAGDQIVKMTEPPKPSKKEQPVTQELPVTDVASFEEYQRRMVLLAGKDITFHVVRADGDQQPVAITVRPTYRHDLGLRMRMNEIVALRAGGNAEKAGVIAHNEGTNPTRGDRIKAVLLPPDASGARVWFVNGPIDFTKPEFAVEDSKKVVQKPLDPLLLPHQLNQWANGLSGPVAVELVVLREDAASHTDVSKRLKVEFDPSYRFDRESCTLPNSPIPISGLGLAYWVDAGIDEVAPGGPAAAAGVQRDDVIVAVRFKSRDAAGNLKAGEWKEDLKSYQWASAESAYQAGPPELDIRVKRGEEVKEFTLTGAEHKDFPTDDRGLIFQTENQVQKAADVGDAIRLGAQRTTRFIKVVYMNLYAMAFGRVSVKTMSGPLTIATVSYRFAGEDFWQFLLFLGMISVNLAVVNFLPIPVLDGGHMVFLLLEKVLGRPVPERLFAVAMYTGLFLILSLMVFVIAMDVRRLFFGWF
ncbi:site-2 protease family protein [Gemmata sp. JC673]|uniref:Site-2 protease family protein n=1 Tax=Gemmata algarum TaxID=2975278 RepID=A0ABU5F279_9BACT|nr:site-2 protease family protein [Gemmata algarum]MDY3561693.1 site-2 protease family protein [Gemmata algarum]